jgi:hypothetical protein
LDLRKSVGFIAIPVELLSHFVRYLNNAKTPSDKKIVSILEQLLALEEIGSKKTDRRLEELERDLQKMDRRLNELNRDLRRYLFRLRFAPSYDANWRATRWSVHWYSGRPGRTPMVTFGPLDMLVDLARAGHLNHLRRCNRCRNWLYARSRNQLFCSLKCQQKNYTETEAFKAYRRQYMRDRYRQQFSRRESAKD